MRTPYHDGRTAGTGKCKLTGNNHYKKRYRNKARFFTIRHYEDEKKIEMNATIREHHTRRISRAPDYLDHMTNVT